MAHQRGMLIDSRRLRNLVDLETSRIFNGTGRFAVSVASVYLGRARSIFRPPEIDGPLVVIGRPSVRTGEAVR